MKSSAEQRPDQKMVDRGKYKGGEGAKGKFVPDYKNGCAICGDREHWKNECPLRGTDRDRFTNSRGRGKGSAGRGGGQGYGRDGAQIDGFVQSNQLRSSDCNRCKYAGKNISTCISCKQTGNVDHCVLHCEQYLCLGVEDRVKLVRTANACAVCLNAGHQAATCNFKDKDNWICGIKGCRSHHHPTLHGSKDGFIRINSLVVEEHCRFEDVTDWDSREGYKHDSYLVNEEDLDGATEGRKTELRELRDELRIPGLGGDQVLLVVQGVSMVYGTGRMITEVVTFFDDGSTCSIILNSVAKQFGLLGESVTVTIETLNAVTTKETMIYMVELLNRDGRRRLVRTFGFDNISEPIGTIELEGVKGMFSAVMQEKWSDWGVRPEGAIQLLVGSEVASLHPIAVEVVENLVIKSSMFGTGLVLNGGHPSIKSRRVKMDSTVAAVRQGKFAKVNRIALKYTQERDFSPQ